MFEPLDYKRNIWFFSDPHAGHVNICKGTSRWENKTHCRDFSDKEEMLNTITQNINSVVGANDQLICLGDWNFGNPKNGYKLRKKIKCEEVMLIHGNHDSRHRKQSNSKIFEYSDLRFNDLFELGVHEYFEFFYQKTRFVLFHHPIASWNEMSNGSIHLFGHCHSTPENVFFNGGKSMDVGLDGNHMMPYHIDTIMHIMKDRPNKFEGHHQEDFNEKGLI